MNFIDRTGHIFTLDSYDEYPIGYEYEETPYIFWFDTEKGYKLSVDNYYFKPIRIVTKVKEGDSVSINIKIENSNLFHLIDSNVIENKLLNINSINDSIELFEDSITSSQELNYVEVIPELKENENEIETNTFKGCLVNDSDEDNPIYIGKEEYFVNALSNKEYKGEVYGKDDLIGESYLGEDNEYHEIDENTDSNLYFGEITIGTLTKYVKLNKLERTVEITDDNRDNIIPGTESVQNKLYLINTFYVVVKSEEPGIWSTNVLINVDDEWCPVTVSAEIIDEAEELIINGQNMGIKLPKEIIQAVYTGNYNINVSDEKIYYLKLKEYLLNYMSLKGEQGNYRSALNSLKWFEWGDKLNVSTLMRNDNRIQRQYVKDFFDIINDNLYSYHNFKDTALLSITMNSDEDGDAEEQIQSKETGFIGEGKPVVNNILNSLKEVKYDEKEYSYYRGYFNFTFNDLGLKLAALKYYYEKYFLPLYIRVHEIYINKHVYTNDIKLINKTSNGITANPIFIMANIAVKDHETNEIKSVVINNNYDTVYFNRYYKKDETKDYITYDLAGNPVKYNLLYVDKNFNEFSHYTKEFVEADEETYYEVNETCLRIPISLPHNPGGNEYYNVTLMLSRYVDKDKDIIVEDESNRESNLYTLLNTSLSFVQTDAKIYQGIVLYPKIINEMNSNKFDVMYWLNNRFRIDLIVNNNPYELIFTTKMPEFNIEMGTLEYKYDDKFRQISSIEKNKVNFNACMYLPNLVNVNNIDFSEELIQLSDNITEYVNKNYKESIKFLNNKYLNACHLINLTDKNGNRILFNGGSDTPILSFDDLPMFASESNNIKLYENFFNEDGSYNFDESLLYINKTKYDLYLMHDYQQWYVVLISKEPVDYVSRKDSLFKFNNGSKKVKIGKYMLTYVRSDRKFLINRFIYVPSNGINHFNKNDIIVASLKNNDKLCFKLSSGSKWNITPMSLRMQNVNIVTSNTELAIISIPDKFSEYERGYYSLSLEYSVDDYATHIYTNKTQFKITDEPISHYVEQKVEINYNFVRIPLQSRITHVQPMTGIAASMSSSTEQQPWITMEFMYIFYKDVCNEEGIFDWSSVEENLNIIASRKHHAIVRLCYVYPGRECAVPDYIKQLNGYQSTWALIKGENTEFPDWRCEELQQYHLNFYREFANKYDDDNRIAFIETGFGLWAEYHIHNGPFVLGQTFPSKEFQTLFAQTVNTLFNKTPWMISIDAANSDNTPFADNDDLLSLNFGNFDDSFMCEEHDYNERNWNVFGNRRYRVAPFGGELSYAEGDQEHCLDAEGIHGRIFESEVNKFHMTFILGGHQYLYQTEERLLETSMCMGYKFKIEDLNVKPGEARLLISNVGVAPIYYDAYFAINGVRNTYNLSKLMPGSNHWITIKDQSILVSNCNITIESDKLLPGENTIEFIADIEA